MYKDVTAVDCENDTQEEQDTFCGLKKQDGQCTYNVTLRRVRITTVTVEKQ